MIKINRAMVTKVKRIKRGYRPFESKNPRTRSSCPNCGSLNIRKRVITMDYRCYRCGWEGNVVTKVDC